MKSTSYKPKKTTIMKKKNFIKGLAYFMLACFVVIFTACDKDNDDDNGNDNGNGNGTNGYHMIAKIDGQPWASAANQLMLVDDKMGYLVISGALNDNDDEVITIQMFDFPRSTGIYPLGTGEYDVFCFYTSSDDITYYVFPSESDTFGTLTITAYSDETITGEFSFTAMEGTSEDLIEITDGSFHMPVFQTPG